jgi:hypothetical protein
MDTVTPEQAVTRGWWMVTAPSLAVLVIPLAAYAIWMPGEYRFGVRGMRPVAALLFFGVGLSWLAWSILVPRWRLWAYERVSNIVELKRRAVAAKLIWPEGSILERTELASKELRARLQKLELAKGATAKNDA